MRLYPTRQTVYVVPDFALKSNFHNYFYAYLREIRLKSCRIKKYPVAISKKLLLFLHCEKRIRQMADGYSQVYNHCRCTYFHIWGRTRGVDNISRGFIGNNNNTLGGSLARQG